MPVGPPTPRGEERKGVRGGGKNERELKNSGEIRSPITISVFRTRVRCRVWDVKTDDGAQRRERKRPGGETMLQEGRIRTSQGLVKVGERILVDKYSLFRFPRQIGDRA